MDYTDLTGLNGQDNQGGLTQKVYYAPLSYFTAAGIKKFKASPSVPNALEIDGTHVFKSGKGWHTLYTTMDTSKLMAELTGERDGHGYGIKVECFHPGGKREAAGFARAAKNDQFIVLVESPNGEIFQIGTENLFAEIKGKYDSGTLSSGRNGWTFEIASFANGLIYYEGAITLHPAALQAA